MKAQIVNSLAIDTVINRPEDKTFQKTSGRIIPAVPGEYYTYSSKFTRESPVYALLKCKSNKNHPVTFLKDFGCEANLFFLFKENKIQICPIKMAFSHGLLGHFVDSKVFSDIWLGVSTITKKFFYEIQLMGEVSDLKKICRTSCAETKVPVLLRQESIITMMTDHGKYGMFLVKDITATSIEIDACHVLV
jgi:hypothetical protein